MELLNAQMGFQTAFFHHLSIYALAVVAKVLFWQTWVEENSYFITQSRKYIEVSFMINNFQGKNVVHLNAHKLQLRV